MAIRFSSTPFFIYRSTIQLRSYSIMPEDNKLSDFLDYMERLKNYERLGVPEGAGTDSDDGFDLGRMRRLLQRLGNPHTHFRAVHVAGTKGKGSTVSFLSNILREGGYSIGCYTSPHILTIREGISFGKNGDCVSAEALMNLFHQVKEVIDQSIELENGALTYFEVFTALAFALFSQEKVDIAIIEAGLGGARDATNVLRSTELAASIITSMGEEHLAALGGSLESIAMAKSGIIKRGRPLVMGGPFEYHIERIIRDKALSLNSPVVSACDPDISSNIICIVRESGNPYQICDILIQVQKDLKLVFPHSLSHCPRFMRMPLPLQFSPAYLFIVCEKLSDVLAVYQPAQWLTPNAWKPSASKCSYCHLFCTLSLESRS